MKNDGRKEDKGRKLKCNGGGIEEQNEKEGAKFNLKKEQ
jgi:hypothetical protein